MIGTCQEKSDVILRYRRQLKFQGYFYKFSCIIHVSLEAIPSNFVTSRLYIPFLEK